MAAADIVYNEEELPSREYAQVFARDRFQLFARFRGATMLETDHYSIHLCSSGTWFEECKEHSSVEANT